MRALSVEPDQIIEQLVIEQIHVGKQQILMVTGSMTTACWKTKNRGKVIFYIQVKSL